MVFAALVFALAADGLPGVEGEIGYRVSIVPAGSVGARVGLRTGDILAEAVPLPARLRGAGPDGVEIPLFRQANGVYRRTTLRVIFAGDEARRLGTTGDFGFLITGLRPAAGVAREAGLRVNDFVPKIDETFVHAVADMKLIEAAREKGAKPVIEVLRWRKGEFVKTVLRPEWKGLKSRPAPVRIRPA